MIEFGRIEIGGLDVKITADNRPSPAEQQNRYDTWPGHPPSSPQPTHMFRSSDNDPLTAAIAPPKNESIAAHAARLHPEAAATGKLDVSVMRSTSSSSKIGPRQRPSVLLGQSESGAFRASSCPGTSLISGFRV